MRKYKVKGVIKQSSFDIVQLEPMRSPLLLEEEIEPGCIQHIITNIIGQGRYSKDLYNRMCCILCCIYMDDSTSRNTATASTHTLKKKKRNTTIFVCIFAV